MRKGGRGRRGVTSERSPAPGEPGSGGGGGAAAAAAQWAGSGCAVPGRECGAGGARLGLGGPACARGGGGHGLGRAAGQVPEAGSGVLQGTQHRAGSRGCTLAGLGLPCIVLGCKPGSAEPASISPAGTQDTCGSLQGASRAVSGSRVRVCEAGARILGSPRTCKLRAALLPRHQCKSQCGRRALGVQACTGTGKGQGRVCLLCCFLKCLFVWGAAGRFSCLAGMISEDGDAAREGK